MNIKYAFNTVCDVLITLKNNELLLVILFIGRDGHTPLHSACYQVYNHIVKKPIFIQFSA